MKTLVKILAVLSVFLISSIAQAEVVVRERHIMIFYPGVDAVWGNYLFMIENSGTESIHYEMDIMLPKETVDWQGQDNLSANDIRLADDGGLRLSKEIPPPGLMLSIGFKIPASGGTAKMTIEAPFDIGQLGLFFGDQTLELEGQGFEVQRGVPFGGRSYDTYMVDNVESGAVFQTVVRGVPEGRSRYWIIGGVVSFGILVLGGFAAIRTMPKNESVETEVVA